MKTHLCDVCGKEYEKQKMGQKVCSPGCAIEYSRAERAYFEDKRPRKAKTKSDTRAEAQAAFNKYIRVRDGNVCISCGTTTGQFHAGHYRTRAAAPQLAFNHFNCHSQCAQCNNYKSGNITAYRDRLVRKIGEEKVLLIEADQRVAQFSEAYLERVKSIYNRRARHLERLRLRIASQCDNLRQSY